METVQDDRIKEICHLKHKTGGWTGFWSMFGGLGMKSSYKKKRKKKKIPQ